MILHKFVKEFLNDSSVESKSAANFTDHIMFLKLKSNLLKKSMFFEKLKSYIAFKCPRLE